MYSYTWLSLTPELKIITYTELDILRIDFRLIIAFAIAESRNEVDNTV